MERFNWKIFGLALWTEVVLCYLLPFRVTGQQYQAGSPVPFITVYEGRPGINAFMSMSLDPIGLLFDVSIVYLVLLGCVKAYQRSKSSRLG